MSNSSLVSYTKICKNKNHPRNHAIDRISIHCYVGNVTVEDAGAWFSNPECQASCNYVIGKDGRVGLIVDEGDRSWCTSSSENDNRAVTIECASNKTDPYKVNDAVYDTIIKLVADICKRNGKTKILWFADKDKTLAYKPKDNEMVMTVHRWFANKACPGNYLYEHHGDIAEKVNAILSADEKPAETPKEEPKEEEPEPEKEIYRVRKTWTDSKSQLGAFEVLDNAKKLVDQNPGYSVYDKSGKKIYPEAVEKKETEGQLYKVSIANLNIRKGPSIDDPSIGKFTGIGVFTIVEIQNGRGSNSGWGLLKAYKDTRDGWISLDYAKKV